MVGKKNSSAVRFLAHRKPSKVVIVSIVSPDKETEEAETCVPGYDDDIYGYCR